MYTFSVNSIPTTIFSSLSFNRFKKGIDYLYGEKGI
jgi:hypothetical protein